MLASILYDYGRFSVEVKSTLLLGAYGYCKKIVGDIKLTLPISAKGIEFFKEYSFEVFKDYEKLHELPGNGLVSIDLDQSIHYEASGFRIIEAMLSEKECSVINNI